MEDWKKLKTGRERIIYAMGMLNAADEDTYSDACNEVYKILMDTLEHCSIYEDRPLQRYGEPAKAGEADEG